MSTLLHVSLILPQDQWGGLGMTLSRQWQEASADGPGHEARSCFWSCHMCYHLGGQIKSRGCPESEQEASAESHEMDLRRGEESVPLLQTIKGNSCEDDDKGRHGSS